MERRRLAHPRLFTIGKSVSPGLMFVLPAVAFLAAFTMYPLLRAARLSVSKLDFATQTVEFIGFENYMKLFHSGEFWNAATNTVIWILVATAFQFGLGLLGAILLNQNIRGRSFFRVALLLPWTVPVVVIAVSWIWLFHSDFGAFNLMISQLGFDGLQRAWLGDPSTAFSALILTWLWMGYPFVMLMLLGGLQSVPQSYHDAAIVDGANSFQAFVYVVIPWLKPIITVVLLLQGMQSLNMFTLFKIMTGGGPLGSTDVLTMFIYRRGFNHFHFEEASAAGVVVFVATLVMTVAYLKAVKEEATI